MSNIKEQSDYCTKEQYDSILNRENDAMFRIIYRFMGEMGLRVGEIVGTTIENPDRKARKKKRWFKSLPGMTYGDIDRTKASELGYSCKHTIHLHRKRHKEGDLPLPDALYDELENYIDHMFDGTVMAPNTKLFPTSRVTVHVRLAKLGEDIGINRLHAHALRRFFGRYEHMVKHTPLQVIQAVYDHEKLAMTLHYLRMGKTEGLTIWAKTMNQPGVK